MKNKLVSLLLSIIMIVTYMPSMAYAVDIQGENATYIAFTSDVHYNGSTNDDGTPSNSLGRMKSWLANVPAKIGTDQFDEMAFCGDYGDPNINDANKYWSYSAAVMDEINDNSAVATDGFFVNGNHEWQNGDYGNTNNETKNRIKVIGTNELVNDAAYVYSFGASGKDNQTDTGFKDSDIANLENYLKNIDSTKPVFIISHYPLHSITENGKLYRDYKNNTTVINLLNKYSVNNNIFFIWGHNHSKVEKNGPSTYTEDNYDKINTTSVHGIDIDFVYAAGGAMTESPENRYGGYVKGKGLVAEIEGDSVHLAYYSNDYKVVAEDTISLKLVTKHTITATAGEHGSISPETSNVVEGESKTFSFTPDKGYVVDKVLIDGVETSITDNSYTFENVQSEHSISVTFKERELPAGGLVVFEATTKNPTESKTINTNDSILVQLTNGSSTAYTYTVDMSKAGVAELVAGSASTNIAGKETAEYEFKGLKDGTTTITFSNNNGRSPRKATLNLTVTTPLPDIEENDEVDTILFTSDIHNDGENITAGNLNTLINTVASKEEDNIELLAACGDFGEVKWNESNYWNTAQVIFDNVKISKYIKDSEGFYIPGNHEYNPGNINSTSNMSKNYIKSVGTYKVEDNYILYNMGATQYGEEFLDDQITALKDFLENHDDFNGPIFILSHYPLHTFNGKTSESTGIHDGNAAVNAGKLLTMLNEYSNAENVVFLWGHNHGSNQDYYDSFHTSINGTNLNFTYCAAGCMKYDDDGINNRSLVASISGNTCRLSYYGYTDKTGVNKTLTFNKTACDHSLIKHDAKAANCTDAGNTEYYECTKCHKYYSDANGTKKISKDSWVIPAKGHSIVKHSGVAATCTEPGYEAYETCSKCDYTTYKEIAAKGHSYGKLVSKVDATCTTDGMEAHYKCSVCDKYFDAEKKETIASDLKITKLGHDYVHHDAKNPTCTEIGWDAYDTCKNCNYSTYKEKSALGHSMTTHNAVSATCEKPGNTKYYECTRCNKYFSDRYGNTSIIEDSWIVPAKGHTWNSGTITTQPTCTAKGVKTITCTTCRATKTEEVDALGHDIHQYAAKDPTCTEDGYKAYEKCSMCSYTTYEAISKLGHNYESISLVPATTTADGYTAHKKCTRCGDEQNKIKINRINTINLDKTEYVYDGTAKTPTATIKDTSGKTLLSSTDYSITYSNNVNVGTNAKATITFKGNYSGSIVKTFNIVSSSSEIFNVTINSGNAYTYVNDTTNPSIVVKDSKNNTLTYNADYTTNFTYNLKTGQGTLKIIFKGNYASNAAITRTFDILCPHKNVSPTSAVEPTCTSAGNSAYWHCNDCDKYFSNSNCTTVIDENSWIINKLGHDYIGHPGQAATCTDDGWEPYNTCSRCKYSNYKSIPALGHDYVHHDAKNQTCIEVGCDAYDTCNRCDYTTYHEKPAVGHIMQTFPAQQATCQHAGNDEYFQCTTCHKYYSDADGNNEIEEGNWIIAKIDHIIVHHDGVTATCTEPGYAAYDACNMCNYSTYKEIPASGHEYTGITDNPAGSLFNGKGHYECKQCHALGNSYTIYGTAPSYVKSLKLKKAKKAITVKFKKQSKKNQKSFGGYQIRYSTTNNVNTGKPTTAKKSASSKKIKKLKAKTKYYVWVRTYTKTSKGTFYSKWSGKSIKTK